MRARLQVREHRRREGTGRGRGERGIRVDPGQVAAVRLPSVPVERGPEPCPFHQDPSHVVMRSTARTCEAAAVGRAHFISLFHFCRPGHPENLHLELRLSPLCLPPGLSWGGACSIPSSAFPWQTLTLQPPSHCLPPGQCCLRTTCRQCPLLAVVGTSSLALQLC